MPTSVTDFRSSKDEQVAHAAEVLQGSAIRIRVFEAIYRGKKKVKSRSDIEALTGLNNKQVLNAGKVLVHNLLVTQETVEGETAYRKDESLQAHKRKIIRLARDPGELKKQPRSSQVRGRASNSGVVKIVVSAPVRAPKQVTIDEIDSFRRVQRFRAAEPRRVNVSEKRIKEGVKRIIGETAEFKDWGGEDNDVSTTRVRIGGRRCPTVFAFKGPAQTGKLTPKKMGKNGDQVQRLFRADADLFVVQYIGEIAENLVAEMAGFALAKAASTGKIIRYCVIDGQDTSRLMKAYPQAFEEQEPVRARRSARRS